MKGIAIGITAIAFGASAGGALAAPARQSQGVKATSAPTIYRSTPSGGWSSQFDVSSDQKTVSRWQLTLGGKCGGNVALVSQGPTTLTNGSATINVGESVSGAGKLHGQEKEQIALTLSGGKLTASVTASGACSAKTTLKLASVGQYLGTVKLARPHNAKGASGSLTLFQLNGQRTYQLSAEHLHPNKGTAYALWLYDSKTKKAKFLGFNPRAVTATGSGKGDIAVSGKLPADAAKYNRVLLTLEHGKATKPSTPVIAGTLKL
ncbi:MAG: hypothetical protein J2O48_05285 [Solirubrobacterales bacterium]|nr:hypothetical protein [Solirubrobacterales bacterium]